VPVIAISGAGPNSAQQLRIGVPDNDAATWTTRMVWRPDEQIDSGRLAVSSGDWNQHL
jgi:hypothetical protein